MRENYTLTRLYVETALGEGAAVELSKDQAHYLGNVLRKGAGDAVRLFNAEDGEWRAEISAVSKRAATLLVTEQLRDPKACPDITLCFAPVRKHRTTFIIEKAAELGVRTLQPVITARTQFPKFNVEKARLQAIEAAEQTERLDIPVIEAPQKLDAMLMGWDTDRSLIFADEAGGAKPAAEALRRLNGPAAILIGPEGGFTPQERELLHAQDFVTPVSLGPRILRADTAALSLLTLWQAAQGDWR
ncbi:16S rRNA (uracil(1498)-N(3))-methyltransferase [Hellea sp.]|nr:16S rRNA (uracil(1498)-N(3))-methyltransferase [Hellea sp.]